MSASARRGDDYAGAIEDQIVERGVADASAQVDEKRKASRPRADGNHQPGAEVGCPAVRGRVEARGVVVGVAAVNERAAQADVRVNAFVFECPRPPWLAEATLEPHV